MPTLKTLDIHGERRIHTVHGVVIFINLREFKDNTNNSCKISDREIMMLKNFACSH